MALSRSRERLFRRISTRRGRETEGVVLLEGPRVIATALELGAELVLAICDEGTASGEVRRLRDSLAQAGVPIAGGAAETLRDLADTDTPQGLLALAREPRRALPDASGFSTSRVLVLDRVQDPGNVGTIIRAGAALGADLVFVLDGTADPWGSKAVRASAGLVFKVPIHSLRWDAVGSWLRESGLPLLVADRRGEDLRAWLQGESFPEGRGWALLLGNEGSGPRPEVRESARASIAIPLLPGAESINVAMAGAILLWALGPGRERPHRNTEGPL